MKKHYLVVYDYDKHGVWAVINARSKDEITKKFPDLKVVDNRPIWMTEELYKRAEINRFLDIDDKPVGWFADLRYLP